MVFTFTSLGYMEKSFINTSDDFLPHQKYARDFFFPLNKRVVHNLQILQTFATSRKPLQVSSKLICNKKETISNKLILSMIREFQLKNINLL